MDPLCDSAQQVSYTVGRSFLPTGRRSRREGRSEGGEVGPTGVCALVEKANLVRGDHWKVPGRVQRNRN